MTIFDETVIAGTVLLPIPFLRSVRLAQQLKIQFNLWRNSNPTVQPGVSARAYGAVIRIAGRARCYPIPFLNGPDKYDARLLPLEGPTPRAWTYADRLSENSREVTLVAEAALRGHIR
jgi:hypothetical protein